MQTIPRLLVAAPVFAALIYAQVPGQPPRGEAPDEKTRIEMRVNFLAQRLSLTDDQKSRAITIFTDAANAGQDERTAIGTARQSMTEAIKKNNTAAIDQAAGEIGRLSGQLMAMEGKAQAAFYLILTPEQQARYDQMPFGGPGPQGPAMGGPGGFRRRPNQ